MGMTVLLFPYAGFFSVLALFAIFLAERRVRVLAASLAFLFILSWSLEPTSFKLPLYLVVVSFVAPTFGALASSRFRDLAKSLVYLATTTALSYLAIIWMTMPPVLVGAAPLAAAASAATAAVIALAANGGDAVQRMAKQPRTVVVAR